MQWNCVPLRRISLVLAAVAGVALAACAPIKLTGSAPSRPVPGNCDVASSNGLALGKASAMQLARQGLAANLADVKGDLVASGLTRVRVISRRMDCKPYPLSPSVKSCTATARVCGR